MIARTLFITRLGHLYIGRLERNGINWQSSGAMRDEELISELVARGVNRREAWEALEEADALYYEAEAKGRPP